MDRPADYGGCVIKLPDKNIESGKFWTHALTLVEGCSPVSEGCLNCWSAAVACRFKRKQERPDKVRMITEIGEWTGDIQLMYEALDKIPRRGAPRIYAVWNDLFHEAVPDEFIKRAWDAFEANPRHTFIIITKRPQRAAEWGQGYSIQPLPNVWFVGTCENQKRLEERAPWIFRFPTKTRGLIIEPMLGAAPSAAGVDLEDYVSRHVAFERVRPDWVIVGCETGGNRRSCDIKHVRSVVDQCQNAGVPVWVKAVEVDGKEVHKLSELPGDLRVREMPR